MTILPVTLTMILTAGAAMAAFSDTDGDGMMSQDEFVAAYPDGTAEQFTAADTDADGMINEAEYTAAVDAGVLPAE